ncbi:MAG TPA: HEAT repeat domain-containing protein [Candidatus Angelobacter sp.]|nr:HEAT repeat domain-containing protein [Candidatus Angelobacter sp.]
MDKKQVKLQGLRFARSLQMLVKMVNMFSADHKSAAGLLQRSYDLLNPLVKQSRHLTLGFVDQRVLLNNILTAEDSLKPLENEFLKRGIGAVTFEAGITLAAYRNAVSAISANLKLIEENGGLLPFLEQRQLEFVRVFPATKTETRNEDGDTVLEMGSEEYLISKALSSMNSGLPQGIESLLTQMEAAGNGAGQGEGIAGGAIGGGGFGNGSGFGSSGGTGAGGTGNGGSGTGNGGGGVAVYHGAGGGGQNQGGYLTEMQRVVEQKFEASLNNPEEDPHKAYVELAKMLRNVRPDFVVSNLMAGKTVDAEANQEEVTAEVFEDTALRWALRRLAATPSEEEAVIVEEQVFRVLMRSLQATHSAARLAQKLAQFAQEYALPKQTYSRIQEEIRWITLTPKQKLRELLAVSHFTAAQFRRCLDLIKELVRLGKPEDAVALGVQYFSIFDNYLALEITEVGRIPELLRGLAGTQGEFWEFAADSLVQALASRKLNQLVHLQVVNALVALAKIAATYEDFMLVQKVGSALEESAVHDKTSHTVCCSASLGNLLPPSAVDRIAEIFFEKKNEAAWTRTVAGILRWAGTGAIERLFVALDKESTAANRLALIRLLGRIGPAGMPAARQRLKHQDWYVVRNACKLLGELKDPELLLHIVPVFEHQDERVQKVALQAVKESKLPGRAAVIANALPLLSPHLVEDALCELMHHASPDSLPGLEKYFNSVAPRNGKVLRLLINVIAAVPHEQAVNLLSKISYSENIDPGLRKAVQEAIAASATRNAREFLEPNAEGIDLARRWITAGRTS